MKENKLPIRIYIIALAALGLISIQIYWILNIITLENERFDRNIKEAINNTALDLEKLEAKTQMVKYLTNGANNSNFNTTTVKLDSINWSDKVLNKKKSKKNQSGFHFEFNTETIKDSVLTKINITNFDSLTNEITKTTLTNISFKNLDSLANNLRILDSNNNYFFKKNDSKNKFVYRNFDFDNPKYKKLDSLNNNFKFDINVTSFKKKKEKVLNEVFDDLIFVSIEKSFKERVSKNILDSLIKESLNKKGIKEKYLFAVINTNKDSIIYSNNNRSTLVLKQSPYKAELLSNSFLKEKYYLYLNIDRGMFNQIKSVLFILSMSVILIVLIISIFYNTFRSYKQQKKVNEIKTDLINNITHEFKTPLSSITLACEVLTSQMSGEENNAKKYLNIINDENKRLKVMVDNLLTTAKLENGEINVKLEKVNVSDLLTDISEKYKLLIDKNNGQILTIIPKQEMWIYSDSFHLHNIISNLVDNGIKYCDKTPKIEITVEDNSNGINISVADNGIGIDKKYYDKIFDTFYRIPSGNIYKGKGYGIGLSYVKKAVKALGGYVIINSTIKTGSKFTIYLPKQYEN